MNMISQLPQPARFESVGERRLPVQVPIAQWTDKERRCNRIREDLMILAHEKAKPKERRAPETPGTYVAAIAANIAKGEAKRESLLALMDGPQTARELSERMEVTLSNVRDMLTVLLREGKVTRDGKTPKVHHGGIADLWVRA